MLSELIPQIAGQDQRRWKYRPRPSSAGLERCIRSMVYNALGIEPKPLPGRSILIMDDSSWHEELTMDWLNKSIYKVHSRQMGVNCLELKSQFLNYSFKCKGCNLQVPENMVHGHIDGILQEPPVDGISKEHLIEHKAVSHFSFQGYETGNLVPYDYISQTVLYEIALRKVLGKDLSFSILFIKNKNTAQYMEYHIEYDDQGDIAKIEIYRVDWNNDGFPILQFVRETYMDDLIAGIKNRFESIDKFYLQKKLPKRQYTYDDWHCQYCGWNEYCWKDYDKEILERKEGVVLPNDLIQKVIDYENSKKTESQAKKEKDKLNKEIKTTMIDLKAKTGIAGGYIVRLSQGKSKTLDKTKIPPEMIQSATKTSIFEKLNINLLKETTKKEEKKNG